ncbi:long-chain fatty acid--CoA ligase [Chloroflexota bacterium]
MSILSDRPWFKFWPEGLPRRIDYPEIPLFEFLSGSAGKYVDKIAFSYEGNSLTYRELDTLSSKLANGLGDLGIAKGDRVLLLIPNNLKFVVAYYGILKAGATVVPTNPLYKGSELKHQISDSGAKAIITSNDNYLTVKEIKHETSLETVILTEAGGMTGTLSLDKILAEFSPIPPEFALNPREDIAAIEYTGGTTGLPKGVMLTHYNLVANAIQNATWFNWTRQEVVIGLIPFYHSWGSCTCLNSPIYTGARVIILPRFNVEELLSTIERERATVLYGAVSMFITLTTSPLISKYDLSSLRYVKAGAMPIPPEIKGRWEQITGVKMILGYGLSEASPETHNSPPQRVKIGTIGIPVFDTDARIVDQETGEVELPPEEVGELVIRGPQVMRGYYNRTEDNKEALRDGWLYTGDLAFMDKEGYFHITDRKKETIKYKGYTIAPAEVEAVLYEHPAVRECAVVGKADPLCGEIPKAYVVLRDGCSLDGEELIIFCQQKVSPYKRIREVEFIDEIPKTQVGKVLRRILRERDC